MAQWLERRWWQRYLRRKDPAVYLSDKRAYWQRVLQQLGHVPAAGAVVLDAGCGPAGIFVELHERCQVTALDPLLEAYQADLDIFDYAAYPSVQFLAQPLETARPAAAPFKIVYCFNAINHVADWDVALDRLTQLTAPGGRLFIGSDVHRWRGLRTLFRRLPGDALHPQQHRPEDYRHALTQRGWRIVREKRLRRTLIFDYVVWESVRQDERRATLLD